MRLCYQKNATTKWQHLKNVDAKDGVWIFGEGGFLGLVWFGHDSSSVWIAFLGCASAFAFFF